jgi:hypothetical protein
MKSKSKLKVGDRVEVIQVSKESSWYDLYKRGIVKGLRGEVSCLGAVHPGGFRFVELKNLENARDVGVCIDFVSIVAKLRRL